MQNWWRPLPTWIRQSDASFSPRLRKPPIFRTPRHPIYHLRCIDYDCQANMAYKLLMIVTPSSLSKHRSGVVPNLKASSYLSLLCRVPGSYPIESVLSTEFLVIGSPRALTNGLNNPVFNTSLLGPPSCTKPWTSPEFLPHDGLEVK